MKKKLPLCFYPKATHSFPPSIPRRPSSAIPFSSIPARRPAGLLPSPHPAAQNAQAHFPLSWLRPKGLLPLPFSSVQRRSPASRDLAPFFHSRWPTLSFPLPCISALGRPSEQPSRSRSPPSRLSHCHSGLTGRSSPTSVVPSTDSTAAGVRCRPVSTSCRALQVASPLKYRTRAPTASI